MIDSEVGRALRRAVFVAVALWSVQHTNPGFALQRPAADGEDAAAAAADRESAAGSLSLLLFDAGGLAPGVRASIEAEITDVFDGAGRVAIVVPDELTGLPSHPYLKVILLAEDGRRFGVGDAHMGANLRVNGKDSDTVYVFLPVVERALDSAIRPLATLSDREIGRGIGRVVAHEVVHAVAPGLAHASSGIMKRTPNLRDLLAPLAHLDPVSTAAVRDGLRDFPRSRQCRYPVARAEHQGTGFIRRAGAGRGRADRSARTAFR